MSDFSIFEGPALFSSSNCALEAGVTSASLGLLLELEWDFREMDEFSSDDDCNDAKPIFSLMLFFRLIDLFVSKLSIDSH